MEYIEEDTGGTVPVVVERWLNREYIPTLSIRRGIISALKNFHSDDAKIMENIPPVIMKPETKLENTPNVSIKKPRMKRVKKDISERRQGTIQENRKKLEDIIEKHNKEQMKLIAEKLKREGKIT
jgi:hypothetical protein